MLGACGGGNGHRDGHPQSAFQPIQQRHHADGGNRPFSRSARRQRALSIIPNGRSGGHRIDQHRRSRGRSHDGAPADYGQDGTSQLGATQAPPLRLRAVNPAAIAIRGRPIRFVSPGCLKKKARQQRRGNLRPRFRVRTWGTRRGKGGLEWRWPRCHSSRVVYFSPVYTLAPLLPDLVYPSEPRILS